ncbi:hypothetical protein BH10PLA2_BH10PLA2_29170 [soil metagenome]
MSFIRMAGFVCLLVAVTSIQADDKDEKKPVRAAFMKLTSDQLLKLWDKNKNGSVEKAETPPAVQALFDKFDKNSDGMLDRAELGQLLDRLKKSGSEAGVKADKGKNKGAGNETDRDINVLLKRLDTNQDGMISRDEAAGRPLARAFDRLDRNKNGSLDRTELANWVQRAAQAPVGKAGKNQGAADVAARNNAVDFDSLDRDADGRVTLAELQGTKWVELFAKIDANKDGHIERKEFENYLRQSPETAKPAPAKADMLKKS